ncbi:MAG: hypothetical protein QF510_09365, partial [Rhodospirillales bacterium]|nr:hypothetical protein [Rhodospirillales bacterium]
MDQPSQTASGLPRDVASNPAAREEQAEPVKSETSEVSESKTSPLASGSDTATTDIGRMFSRIADVFRPSPTDDSVPNTSDVTTVELANNPPTAPTPASKVLGTAATDTAPDDTAARQIMSD